MMQAATQSLPGVMVQREAGRKRPGKRQGISPVWRLQAIRRLLTGRSPANEPRLIHRSFDTALVWLPGVSTNLVVVFLGIQRNSLRQKRLDFMDIASQQGRNHVLFVADLCRSWYSRPGQRDRIYAMIRRFVTLHHIETISTMGGSMGGYGAILFSDLLPVRNAIAFVPQLLLSEDVINRPNWSQNRPNITDAVDRDLTRVMAKTGCHFHILYGDQDEDDRIHLGHLNRELPNAKHIGIVIAPGQKHYVGPWLLAQGQLENLVKALWAEDQKALENCSKALERPLDMSLALVGAATGKDARDDHDQV